MPRDKDEGHRKWLLEDDKKEFPRRLERLTFLIGLQDEDGDIPFPNLTHFYYEEARRCWVMGCYLPTIMMARLTFDNWLRSHFWGTNTNTLASGEALDHAELSSLIEEAVLTNYISKEEAHVIHHLDEDICQPYVKPRDRLASMLQQSKLRGGDGEDPTNVEDDARTAITILSEHFPPMVSRTIGK